MVTVMPKVRPVSGVLLVKQSSTLGLEPNVICTHCEKAEYGASDTVGFLTVEFVDSFEEGDSNVSKSF